MTKIKLPPYIERASLGERACLEGTRYFTDVWGDRVPVTRATVQRLIDDRLDFLLWFIDDLVHRRHLSGRAGEIAVANRRLCDAIAATARRLGAACGTVALSETYAVTKACWQLARHVHARQAAALVDQYFDLPD